MRMRRRRTRIVWTWRSNLVLPPSLLRVRQWDFRMLHRLHIFLSGARNSFLSWLSIRLNEGPVGVQDWTTWPNFSRVNATSDRVTVEVSLPSASLPFLIFFPAPSLRTCSCFLFLLILSHRPYCWKVYRLPVCLRPQFYNLASPHPSAYTKQYNCQECKWGVTMHLFFPPWFWARLRRAIESTLRRSPREHASVYARGLSRGGRTRVRCRCL